MLEKVRDDFPENVKRTVAARAGYRCSNPDCKASTSGPQTDQGKALNLGVAAHITAAASGGPRYDAGLTPEQRSYFSNAVWLCQNCAKLIDNDTTRFSATLLQSWKEHAESEAFTEIGKSKQAGISEKPSNSEVQDKWVSIRYVEEAGILRELEAQEFKLYWATANREAELVDLKGWEIVVRQQSDGTQVRYKIHDHPAVGGYLILLKKRQCQPSGFTA